ncbi:hypothetical protein [Cupriavidus basilensis]|uniref:hypothetical protein n=1 Tax=Cupriavidus basilensis TaxID=68895 RepID=UPI0020A6D9F2|nr:hypothetical protein [Cupriavidus basilensis]MCP3019468.1 hypothetical protein [Cupriavidus basilensis]MDR3384125.1 hypothetical protein [Cupriavidus basilensis]
MPSAETDEQQPASHRRHAHRGGGEGQTLQADIVARPALLNVSRCRAWIALLGRVEMGKRVDDDARLPEEQEHAEQEH